MHSMSSVPCQMYNRLYMTIAVYQVLLFDKC